MYDHNYTFDASNIIFPILINTVELSDNIDFVSKIIDILKDSWKIKVKLPKFIKDKNTFIKDLANKNVTLYKSEYESTQKEMQELYDKEIQEYINSISKIII